METSDSASTVETPLSVAPRSELGSRLALWLALLLVCIAGASVGYFSTKPLYRSDALVQYRQPPRIYEDGQRNSEFDDQFLDGEAAFGRSRTLVDQAMLTDQWKALRKGSSPALAEGFARNLNVQQEKGGTLRFSFFDADPQAAAACLGVAVSTFKDDRYRRQQLQDSKRIGILQSRLEVIYRQTATIEEELAKMVDASGGVLPSTRSAALAEEILRLDREILKAQPAITTASKDAKSPDPTLERLVLQRDQLRQQAVKSQDDAIKFSRLVEERDYIVKEKRQIQERINQLVMENNMGSALTVLSTGTVPIAPAIDHRIRNAACGAMVGLVAFFILRSAWRKIRTRYRVVAARTAFPLIITHTPKPVVPIDENPAEPLAPAIEAQNHPA